jgi:ABC-type multidrug transport system fused ATPase/permease subunit
VIKSISLALKFMTPLERRVYFFFLFGRGVTSILDLVGILLIGFLTTSVAISLSMQTGSPKTVTIASITLPLMDLKSLPLFVVGILFIFISKAVISVVLTSKLARFLARIEARAVRVIAENAYGHGLEKARENKREDVVFAIQVGSQSAFNGLLNSTGVLIAEGVLFLLVLASFAVIDPLAALGAILYFGAVGVLIQFFIGRLMHKTGTKITKSVVETNVGVSDLADIVREASILGIGSYFYDRIYNSRMSASGNYATQFVLAGMPRYIVETALLAAIALFILSQTLTGNLETTAATLAIFLSGGLRLTASLLPLQSALLTLKQSGPSANKAFELIYGGSYSRAAPQASIVSELRRDPVSVKLRNLSFEYGNSDAKVLNSISLEITKGSQVAFIGISGAGKSTIADIILGLLDPSTGEVLIDGFPPKHLVDKEPGIFGYVPQRPGMISGTISENIALGSQPTEIDEVRLLKAIQDANLLSVIEQLPQGLNTEIGNRKDELSGGQLQRIGLARALYSKPKLLIMDEATSALDAESENEINKALDSMRGKVTVILIAHRLNTIQRSDEVFLVENGEITAHGKFSSLMKTNYTVRNLANLMSIKSA